MNSGFLRTRCRGEYLDSREKVTGEGRKVDVKDDNKMDVKDHNKIDVKDHNKIDVKDDKMDV